MADHTTSDRGLKYYEPIVTSYGHHVRVYESSSAMEPKLWLSVEQTDESMKAAGANIEPCRATALLTIDQALQLIENLAAGIRQHYQGV